ncbi:MAG: hypothetical protein IKT70_05540 [Clostridia bacterium]|nr:hypothetical protein [Clostridia bacterium]
MYIPDNEDLFMISDHKRACEERKLPRCSVCHDPITEDFYYCIKGMSICSDCLDRNFRVLCD